MISEKDISEEPRVVALIEMIGRMGATDFELRFQDDQQPVVWIAVASFRRQGGTYFDAAGGMDPLSAIFRLVEIFLDGGTCTHCRRGTGITLEQGEMPMKEMICWYQWDPELKTIRRGCE